MNHTETGYTIEHYFLGDDGVFPGNELPVLLYRQVLRLPVFLASARVRRLFKTNNWYNAWDAGIYEYHHYHSTTHEVLGIYKGSTILRLGGEDGISLGIGKGDVILIPAGVAHKNMGGEKSVFCIGAYPGGMDYDMKYGKPGERPRADRDISKVPLPDEDPVFGKRGGTNIYWKL
jgi:uncharacterized protein YjlB